MTRRQRAILLITTTLAWGVPTLLAMWLDAVRFVEPYVDPGMETYARTYEFQYLAFWVRFGWLLLLVFVAIFAVQVGLTRAARTGSTG